MNPGNSTPSPVIERKGPAGWAFLSVFAVVCAVGAFLVVDLYRSHANGRKRYADAISGLELLGQLQYQTQEARRTLLYALGTKDSNRQVEYADQSRAAEAQAASAFNEFELLVKSPAETRAVQGLGADWKNYLRIRDDLIASMLEGSPKEAVDRDLSEGIPAFNAVRDDLQAIESLFRADADRLLKEMDVSFRHSLARLIIILVLALALATVAVKMLQKNSLLRVVTASEAQLRLSRQKFETLVNSIEGVVWEADPVTFQFSFVSRQGENLLGLPIEDWLNVPQFWVRHLHAEDRERTIEQRRQAVAARKACRLEYRMCGAKGQEVCVNESAAVVTEGGEPSLLRGVLHDVTEQKTAERELKAMHQQLLDTSRRAGMAEVAIGVLHNVGNVLNSVNVSVTLLHDQLRQSRLLGLTKAAARLRERAADLKRFLFEDPKGKLLPEYFIQVSEHLMKERETFLEEMANVAKNVAHIKDIVSMQQSYAGVAGVTEMLPVAGLVEDALQMSAAGFTRHKVEIVREFDKLPAIPLDKHKVLQILLNLAKNATQALEASKRPDKRLVLKIRQTQDQRARICFTDNGIGIAPENLIRIFNHGFTTKAKGHGFGLHSAALAAREMGGSLVVESEGLGAGAAFILELPMASKTK